MLRIDCSGYPSIDIKISLLENTTVNLQRVAPITVFAAQHRHFLIENVVMALQGMRGLPSVVSCLLLESACDSFIFILPSSGLTWTGLPKSFLGVGFVSLSGVGRRHVLRRVLANLWTVSCSLIDDDSSI